MAQLTKVTVAGFTAGSQSSGTSWMTAYTVPQTGIYYITFELAAACIVQLSVDNTNFYPLNGNVPFGIGWNTIAVPLEANDTLNLNQASSGGINVNALRIEF